MSKSFIEDVLGWTQDVVNWCAYGDAVKAVKYVTPKLVVRATRKLYGKRINKSHNIEITLTIGRPNYIEREFIKLCQKAKEPFPVKNIQFKLYKPLAKKLKKWERNQLKKK